MGSSDVLAPAGGVTAAMTATELGPWFGRMPEPTPAVGDVRVVRVVGGAGGAAAVVADLAELASAVERAAWDADATATLAHLALAALDAQPLALLAPAQAAVATDRARDAMASVAAADATARALAASVRLAQEAYDGTEEAITRSWHVVTAQVAIPALVVTVVAGAARGLGAPTGTIAAQAGQVALDGVAERLDGLPSGGPGRGSGHGSGRGPGAADDVVASSAVRDLTERAARTYPAGGGVDVTRLDGPAVSAAPARAGLAGVVAGVEEASRGDEHAVTVRRRTLDGPDGHREAYVVDLPGTDTWAGPWAPGTSPMDARSDLTQMAGLTDDAYVEGVLRLLDDAPPGATVVLAGHSLGGITASTVAAVAASRGRRVDVVVTAGSPVDTMRVPRGTTVVALANDADVVPGLDGMPARDVAGRTTVTVHADRGGPAANHDVGLYVGAAAAADARSRTDPGLARTTDDLRRRGAVVGEGDVVREEVTRWRLTRRP